MEHFRPFIIPILKLFSFSVAGYLLFQAGRLREKALGPLLSITINVLMPLYFIHRFPLGWHSALMQNNTGSLPGWVWMALFFGAYILMLLIQVFLGYIILYRIPFLKINNRKELLALTAIHNAGYIPLPILTTIVPPNVMVYMFFYIMGFNLVFWSIVIPFFDTEKRGIRFIPKMNMPLIGLFLGLFLAITDLYKYIPRPVQLFIEGSSELSINLILFLLGGILASIPRSGLIYRSAYGWFVLLKMIVFPGIFVTALYLIPIHGFDPDIAAPIKLAIVLEAAVPPATMLMVACKTYGSEEQVEFLGGAIILTYLAALLSIPCFLVLSAVLFY